jgi:hypothetical protein
MKINILHLSNFSSHEDSVLEFSKPIALIVGQLNAGKSSILQGIEYALTGECGYHRKRTDSRAELVRDQGQHGALEVKVGTTVGMAQRVRNAHDNVESVAWDDRTQPTAAAMTASITAATKVDPAVLSAILNVSGFFNMEDAQQKEIIIGMIGAEVTDAKVRSEWTRIGGEADALKCLPAGKIDSVRALDDAYTYCFKRRTIAKRELDELKPPAPPEGPKPPLDRMREKLATIEKELQEALIAKAKLEGAASAVSGKKRLEDELTVLKADTKSALARPDEHIRQMQEQEKISKQASETAGKLESEVVDFRVAVATCRNNISLLETFDGRCVAGDHACPAPESDMKVALKQQRQKLSGIMEELQDAEKRHKEVLRIRDDRTEYNRLKAEYDKMEVAVNNRTRQNNRIAEITELLKKPDVTIDKAKIDELTTKATELQGRIEKGKVQIEAAVAWSQREQQVALVAESRKKLEVETRYLNELCDFLGAKGVRVGLIDEKIGTFSTEIEKHLHGFGFSMSLTVDPWSIVINGQPVKRLSASERYRLSVAFQVGIARMSGLNFVICDGSEILTPPVFGEMMGMLATSGLEQAIVIKTLMIPTEQFLKAPPKNPNVECFVVTNTDGVSVVEAVK